MRWRLGILENGRKASIDCGVAIEIYTVVTGDGAVEIFYLDIDDEPGWTTAT